MAEAARVKSNLALRLLTAAVCGPIIIWMLYWGGPLVFPIVTGIVAALGASELFAMLAPGNVRLRAWGVLSSSAVYLLMTLAPESRLLPLGIVALTCANMLIVLAQPEPIESAALRMGWSVAGPLYVGGLFSAVALLFQHDHGGSWVMLALLCGFLSDTAGYFVGSNFGKRQLAPIVSPKKTIEGSLGGLAAGLFSGLLAHFWFLPELPLLHAIFLSIAAAALGQLGDLCESLMKRSFGVKDSGTVLPGHGGILDRSDAMLFSATAVLAYVTLIA